MIGSNKNNTQQRFFESRHSNILLFMFFLLILFSNNAWATDNIVVCGNDNWMDFDDAKMDALQDKANNLSNFGPAGTYGDYSWTFIDIGPTPTTAALTANACQVWLSGYDADPDYTDLPAFISNGGFVIGACDSLNNDAVCGGLSYSLTTITNQPGGYTVTDPPNYLTCDGLVNNDALTLTVAGGASTYFSSGLALGVYDSNGERLVITDSLTAPTFILTGDSELYTTFGASAVTAGPLVTSDQDKFVVNSLKTAADTVTGAVAENGLPDCADISDLLIADLSISKDDSVVNASIGDVLTYTLTVNNAGPEDSGDGITVVDTLPTNVTINAGAAGPVALAGSDAGDWSCGSDTSSPQEISCTYAGPASGILSGDVSIFEFDTDPLPGSAGGTTIVNNAEVFKGDGYGETDFTDNTDSHSTPVSATPICDFGGGIADPLITSYLSDEAYSNNGTTRAAAETFDDAWRTAVGQPANGEYIPWFGDADVNPIGNTELDFFETEGVLVDFYFVNMEDPNDCNGEVNASGNPLLSDSEPMQANSPKPQPLRNAPTAAHLNENAGSGTSRNAFRFVFDVPVKSFGLWVGDLESRTEPDSNSGGDGEAGYMRLLDSAGNRIGSDIAIAPSNIVTSAGTFVVDQDDCGTGTGGGSGSDFGCGNQSTRWVGFVDSAAAARVKEVLYIVGDDDHNGNAFAEKLSVIGADIARDYGDAPLDYGSPSHYILRSPRLIIGSVVPDAEAAPAHSAGADGDDLDASGDDEDGISGVLPTLAQSATSYSVDVAVSNGSGADELLWGWIDFDRDGTFQADEAARVNVPDGTGPGSPVTLTWSSIPAGTQVGTSYLRLRLTSDPDLTDTGAQLGTMIDGEIEDYDLTIEASEVDLTILKSVDIPEPEVGQTVTFTLKVNNLGPADATSVIVTDIVPAGFTYVVGSMLGGDAQNETDPTGAGLIWTINSFTSGAAEEVLTFQAVVNPI